MTREYESHSSITTYCTCPRKYQHKYVDGFELREQSKDLRLGKAWSLFLESGAVPSDSPISGRDLATLEFLAEGYKNMYPDDKIKKEVEVSWKGIQGRLDGLGEGFVLESKLTRSRVDAEYWEQRRLDQQIMAYLYMAQRNGHAVSEVVYDVVKRPMLRPRRGETESLFLERVSEWIYDNRHEVYQRRSYRWTAEQLEHNFDNMLRIIGSMPVPDGYFVQNRNSCRAYGTLCEYFPVCTGDEPLSEGELYTIRTRA